MEDVRAVVIFTSLSKPHATRLLKTYLSMLLNSIGIQCVDQKILDTVFIFLITVGVSASFLAPRLIL